MTHHNAWVVRVSKHAIERYRRRVEDVCDAEVICRLSTPSICNAASIGATAVLLPSGHRVILDGDCVVSVVPKHYKKRKRSC